MNYTDGGGGFYHNHSEKTKELLREIGLGRKRGKYNWTPDGKRRQVEAVSKLRNYKHSEETKFKIGDKQKGGDNHKAQKVLCVTTVVVYQTVNEAAKELKIHANASLQAMFIRRLQKQPKN